ncbi:hypothetical protein GCM10007939_19420 [Amylibacter marinus]|uniref:Ceramidase n=1 Tax=Amylibacter marinus TaxID=1475483 RepID=A0ABQ5VWZ0_9RHOB|nr:ceramidase domain-containing protein [Amylibacter marinus]GLQ35659.1 hypothetical protein GCM10007939_19420 [Amylibacter marinus]
MEFIDLYCERTGAGFWNEPINALSNIAFLVAAYLALRIALARPRQNAAEITVVLMGGLIGIGSFLFHTFANSATELADVIPIWSFVAAYVVLVIYRMTGQNGWKTLRISLIAGTITGTVFWFTSGDITTDASGPNDLLNGSTQYAPALVALAIFALLAVLKKHPARGMICLALVSFIGALVFRSVDLHSCDHTHVGTHFMWHILNATMVYYLLMALVRHLPPKT